MSLFNLFRRGSAPVARDRLQVLLAHERSARDKSDLLGVLREEILAVIARHILFEPDKVQIKMEREQSSVHSGSGYRDSDRATCHHNVVATSSENGRTPSSLERFDPTMLLTSERIFRGKRSRLELARLANLRPVPDTCRHFA